MTKKTQQKKTKTPIKSSGEYAKITDVKKKW